MMKMKIDNRILLNYSSPGAMLQMLCVSRRSMISFEQFTKVAD
jgi:hypothetical protein